jgi:hypothetical protein
VPWVNKQLASSDFIFRRREKANGVKYAKNGAGRTSYAFFHSHLLIIEAAMAVWALTQQKTSSVKTTITITLCSLL